MDETKFQVSLCRIIDYLSMMSYASSIAFEMIMKTEYNKNETDILMDQQITKTSEQLSSIFAIINDELKGIDDYFALQEKLRHENPECAAGNEIMQKAKEKYLQDVEKIETLKNES